MHRARVATTLVGVLVLAACQPAAIAPEVLTPVIQTGRADSAEGAISITTDDWTYSVPMEGVTWIDEAGVRWEDGRPGCLAPGVTRMVRFAAVQVSVEGTTWRPVVWVSCQ